MDDDLLTSAREVSGERAIKATVRMALELLVSPRQSSEQDLWEWWSELGDVLADLQDDAVMRAAWS